MDPWLSRWQPDSLHYAVLDSNEIELCVLSLQHIKGGHAIEGGVSENYSLWSWSKRSFSFFFFLFFFWKVNEACLHIAPDLRLWFQRGHHASRLPSMHDELGFFCFHLLISGILPRGVPVLTHKDEIKCEKKVLIPASKGCDESMFCFHFLTSFLACHWI